VLSFPPAVRIWLALEPADLRKGFDALAELVRQHLRDDPLSGHVYEGQHGVSLPTLALAIAGARVGGGAVASPVAARRGAGGA
jgi:transposase